MSRARADLRRAQEALDETRDATTVNLIMALSQQAIAHALVAIAAALLDKGEDVPEVKAYTRQS